MLKQIKHKSPALSHKFTLIIQNMIVYRMIEEFFVQFEKLYLYTIGRFIIQLQMNGIKNNLEYLQ